MIHRSTLVAGAVAFGALLGTTQAQLFDTLSAWGNASGTTPAPAFTDDGKVVTIDAGGADFWGNSDQGAFLWDSGGAFTTTGDYFATVRHISTTVPAPTWGRDGIYARATTGGTPVADNALVQSIRRSDGNMVTGWRDTAAGGTGRDDAAFPQAPTGPVDNSDNSYFLALGRTGGISTTGYAADLYSGDTTAPPTPGRWFQHATHGGDASTDGLEVTVGLGHQSHPQSGGGSGNGGVNTGTFADFSFAASYPAVSPFVTPAADYAVGGRMMADPGSGSVSGAAYTFENGVATGEPVGWIVRAVNSQSAIVFNTPQNSTAALLGTLDQALVPAANFRTGPGGTPGLNADIYLAANGGNLAANQATIAGNAPNGTTIVPDVWWSEPGSTPDGYPDAIGGIASNGGANTTNLFHLAVLATDPVTTAFTGNQDSYGVHLTGEIFIPDDATRGGQEFVAFKDGVDDFTYLVIDGNQLMNDNSWTGAEATQNNGGAVSLLDTSDAKYDDGEWVGFEMIAWEGGGGDPMVLHWDLNGADGVGIDPASFPEAVIVNAEYVARGVTQVGDDATDGLFPGVTIPSGLWTDITLTVFNTSASSSVTATDVNIDGTPFAITDIVLNEGAGTVDLTFNSIPGANYAIDFSTDLINWLEIADDYASGGASTTVLGIVIDPAGSPNMNYRVRLAP